MIYQIDYYSISEFKVTDELLSEILESSRKNNLKKDITGCLLYHKKIFLQLLEGKKEDVLQLFEVIKKDKRHNNVTLIINEDVNERMFPGWNMAYNKSINKSEVESFVNSIDCFSENIPKKSESIDLFWRMARQIITK